MGIIIVLNILLFRFLDIKRDKDRFWTAAE
jgi:hypothetical protein